MAVFAGAREVDSVNIVSPLELYLALKALAGRGEDATEKILQGATSPAAGRFSPAHESPPEGEQCTRSQLAGRS